MMRGRDGVNNDGCSADMDFGEYASCSYHPPAAGEAASTLVRDKKGKNNVPCPVRREALILNHQAVNILMFGAGEEKALRILKLALSHMRYKLASSSGRGATSADGSRSTATAAVVDNEQGAKEAHTDVGLQSYCDDPSCRLLVPLDVSKADESVMNNSSFFLYSKVFTFQHVSNNVDDNMVAPSCLSSMIDSESLSSTIIYNIAMILTMKGLRTNNTVMLKKALDLFKLSLGLLQDPSKVHCSSMSRSLAIVTLNNSGHIAYLLCDFDHVQTVRRTLQSLLTVSFTTFSEGADPLLCLFDEVEIQGFKSNIMFMYPPNTAPAA